MKPEFKSIGAEAARREESVLLGRPAPRRQAFDGWLDRWVATVGDLARLKAAHPMLDAVIEEQRGRQIRIGNHWLTDWASCNYLGLDLDAEVIASIPEYVSRWGTHPSWSRLLGSPRPYVQIEEQLTELLGCEDVLAMPTITHIHMSVLPVLAGEGTVFLDGRAHKTIYDGAMVAAGRGASVVRFRPNDAGHLEELMRATNRPGPRLIAMDGVNSMTGNAPDLVAFSRIAQQYDGLLYVDDAHGFGIIGERSPNEPCPYGIKGNSLFRHHGVGYDNAVLVGGLSKAYSSLLAFLALPTRLKDALKVLAPPYLYSGPAPVASLATTLAGLEVNRKRGDALRADVYRMTGRVLGALRALGIRTPNQSGLPIIEIPLANHEEIDAAGQFLFDRGIYVTMAAFPLVPKNEVGFRIQVTAANTDDEVQQLIAAIVDLSENFRLQQPPVEAPAKVQRREAARAVALT
jgi:8-amino-7-oxononanoate synthase